MHNTKSSVPQTLSRLQVKWPALKWAALLYHEYVYDEIGVRAESLSYFTLFSILPLLAGLFLLLGVFSQWGPVQSQFQELITRALQPIPEESRDQLIQFVLQYKSDYLKRITDQSSSIGIFAIGVLVWIGLRVFFNIENLMNQIWRVQTRRPLVERVKNFIFCSLIAPFVGTIALILPGILRHFGDVKIGTWLDQGLPAILLFITLLFMFRYLPNVNVRWKSAAWGAFMSSFVFVLASLALTVYFRFGTQTAYGKMAVLPIVAFFIYVFWVIVLMGAELSFIIQNQDSAGGQSN